MNKKAIAILGAIFLLIVGTLGFLIYSKYSTKKTDSSASGTPGNSLNTGSGSNQAAPNPFGTDNASTTVPDSGNNSGSASSNNSGSAFARLGDDQVVSPVLFYSGAGITYFDFSGKLYQADFDQQSDGSLKLKNRRALDVQAPKNLSRILWPNQGDNFIAVAPDSHGQNSYSFFNSDTRSFVDLPAQVTALDWTPNGDKIVYIWTDNGKSTLNIGDPDARNWREIAEMWENDDQLRVSPDGASIAYYQYPSAMAVNKITITTPDGKVWKDLAKDGYNSGVLWSPDSQKILFAKKDKSGKFQLWYYGINSGEIKSLPLFTTADKAVWDKDSQTIYAAVPVNGSAGEDSLTVDTFFRLDTSTMDKKEYKPEPGINIDGRNLFLNSGSDKLLFKNFQDNGLYYLDLTK